MDFDDNSVSPFVPAKNWNSGLSANDRLHNMRINFLYDVPNAPWKNVLSRWTLNGWQVSGITGFVSGAPANVSPNAEVTTAETRRPPAPYYPRHLQHGDCFAE